jgi:DUF4097 and DUF4098 domain-containing protein YvlB
MSWLYSILFIGFMFSGGGETKPTSTAPASPDETVITSPAGQNETERIEKSFPLNANGRLRVSNVNGSITLTAWDRNEVRLVAVKSAETKELLSAVDIKIESRPDYLSIETDYGDWKFKSDRDKWRNRNDGNVTVDYELSVPRGASLNEIENVNGAVTLSKFTNFAKVSAVNGSVRATNLRGTADLSTVNGEVIADIDQLEAGSKISLETVNGSASLIIPSDSNATIKAESLNGIIANDFGLPVRKGRYVGRDLYGKIGSGEVSIKLGSVNGPLWVKRRNDGRSLSPATNLLPAKGAEDEDWDGLDSAVASQIAKANQDVARNVTRAQRQATLDAQRELAKVKIDKITKETMKDVEKSIEAADIKERIQESLEKQKEALAGLRDASFFMGMPRIETRSDSIPVKGIPKVTIDARDCAVRVRGWDKQEVQYSVSELRSLQGATPLTLNENHSDSSLTIKITANGRTAAGPIFNNSSFTRIDVFVPRKSNLKIISDKEIRLDGVSGDLEITGADEPVNIRDSQGRLSVSNADGRIRVIGFDGDVVAKTGDGDVYLEGRFSKVVGKAEAGNFTLTLPADTNADLASNTDVEADGFELVKRGSQSWRLGSGGTNYSFELGDGKLMVRNSSALSR